MTPSAFLDAFFSSPNRMTRADVQVDDATVHPAITRSVEALLQEQAPVVLPRQTGDGEVWYGVATTEKDAQRLAEEVQAFVGPSFSTYDGGRAVLDRSDLIEDAVYRFTDGRALRFTGDDDAIREALYRMLNVRERKTPFEREEDLGVGLLLRRFEMALQAGDRENAEIQLQQMRERQLLESDNLTALTIRMLVAFEAWEEVLESDEIPETVRKTNRPLAVTQALIRAVYHVHVSPIETDPEAAVQRFETDVRSEYGPLFTMRSSMNAPEILKAFMLKAVSGRKVNDGLRDELLQVAREEGKDDAVLTAFAELGREAEPETGEEQVDHEQADGAKEDPLDSAMQAVASLQIDQAFRHLQQAEPSERKVNMLGLIHPRMQSIDVEQEIFVTLQSLPGDTRADLIQKDETLASIYETGGAPSTWTTWFQRVQEEQYSSSEALTYAEMLADNWSPAKVVNRSGAIADLETAVENAPLSGQLGQTVNRALPFLLRSFQDDPSYPRSRFQDVYRAVHKRIPYTDDLTESDLEVYLDLSEMLLRHGVSAKVYREIVSQEIPFIWEEMRSSHHIDWLLDISEVLRLTPARDEEALLQFLTRVVQAVNQFRDAVQPIQVELLAYLCEEVGHPEMAPKISVEEGDEDERDPVRELLDGKTLGIYTLTQSAGRRVESFLEERCPTATIHRSQDKHGGSHLHEIARASDYFLVVTRSASHAATGIIEQHVPTERLIRPRGKGSSSMIRDLGEYAREQMSS